MSYTMDNFEFDKWCEEFELNEETKKAILEQGYNSYRSLRHLDEAKVKSQFRKLQPAQLSLLAEGVELLHPPTQTPAGSRTSNAATEQGSRGPTAAEKGPPDALTNLQKGESLTADQVLDLLKENAAVAGAFNMTDQTSPSPGSAILDPFQFGKNKFGAKLRSVPDYVTSLTRGEQPTSFTLGGMDFISTTHRKLSHDKLSLAQYMEGALRITRDLVTEDGASLEHVMDYINHIIQVALFAQSFTWSSVLSYDRVYRKEQSNLGFRWGTPSSMLMASHLSKSTLPLQSDSNRKKPMGQTKDPKTGKIVCLRFNGYNGCSLKSCSYAHVCRACFEDHPEVQHKSDKTKN